MKETYANPESELVIGLVGPVGVDFTTLIPAITDRLGLFGYRSQVIRISEIISDLRQHGHIEAVLQEKPEHSRIRTYMDAGNRARDELRPDILALGVCHRIHQGRPKGSHPRPKTAYILRSLKNPAEVSALRNTYGPGFFLISLFATEADRLRFLTEQKGIPKEDARDLIDRDAGEEDSNGQQTRDTFHLADAFAATREDVLRTLDLLFGAPFHTPTPQEHGMFLAYAASARSGDLSRQVGAVVTSATHEILAAGCNDVPTAGGGLYWPGPNDQRDHRLGHDSNTVTRNEIIVDLVDRLRQEVDREDADFDERLAWGLTRFAGNRILDLTEYGRAVHAEMEALLSCARTGANCRGGTLYTTTYPCHNCARHIVAAGVSKVVYVEPYPKSLAAELHADSIEFEARGNGEDDEVKTAFVPFIGVGPRRYFDLFSMNLSSGYQMIRKKPDGSKVDWKPESATLRTSMRTISYLERERAAAGTFFDAEGERDVRT